MTQTTDEVKTRALLEKLRMRHHKLDIEINGLESQAEGGLNQLQLKRLKKQKLLLKDEIIVLEDSLLPDIIA
jgi:hypothetical protein